MISINQQGNFENVEKFLKKDRTHLVLEKLRVAGDRGVKALSAATPKNTGEVASSWYYNIEVKGNRIKLSWYNSVKTKTTPVVILLQYGHGTKNGGYVRGIDFINPSIQPIFNEISNTLWREVINS